MLVKLELRELYFKRNLQLCYFSGADMNVQITLLFSVERADYFAEIYCNKLSL